jgi:2-dehydro-3-deoxygluconokinase
MAKRLLSIGECLVEFAPAGAGAFHQGFAGDAPEVARQARLKLGPGWRVGLIGAVGDDLWSERILASLADAGIETDHVARLAGRRPGLSVREAGDAPGACWRDASAARELAADPEALEAAISSAHALHFSGETLAILPPDDRGQLLTALGRAKARGATVAFDGALGAALWPDRGTLRAAIRAAARIATIALPAAADEATLFGEAGAAEVARRYRSDGCPEVVVRAPGGEALVAWGADRRAEIAPVPGPRPAPAAFVGAYLAARLSGAAPDAAAQAAVRPGAAPVFPSAAGQSRRKVIGTPKT